mmetsp:Transcript_107423/g.213282  ORF Transcript_107423/g.213282 Transcript_107423/m.213282 type:complete len:207 (+) Transcript_107423:185-805(+)
MLAGSKGLSCHISACPQRQTMSGLRGALFSKPAVMVCVQPKVLLKVCLVSSDSRSSDAARHCSGFVAKLAIPSAMPVLRISRSISASNRLTAAHFASNSALSSRARARAASCPAASRYAPDRAPSATRCRRSFRTRKQMAWLGPATGVVVSCTSTSRSEASMPKAPVFPASSANWYAKLRSSLEISSRPKSVNGSINTGSKRRQKH